MKEREASQASGLSTWEDEAAFSEPGLVGDHQGLGCDCAECETPVRPPKRQVSQGRAVQGTDIWESSGWSWWLKSCVCRSVPKGPSIAGKRLEPFFVHCLDWVGGTSQPWGWQEPQEPQHFSGRPGHPRAWLGALNLSCLLKPVGQGSGGASTAGGPWGEGTFL